MRFGAALVVAALLLIAPGAHASDDVVWGCDGVGYAGETTEYPHGVLGDEIEYKDLVLELPTDDGTIEARMTLPAGRVFEDLAPRCADLDGDGEEEIVTIESDAEGGASLAVYSRRTGPIDRTPPIGTRFRWLAPASFADFDGDGQTDIAYVETPHLAGILRLWTLRDGQLEELAHAAGFSNHRIGEDFITGGVRTCGDGPSEVVLPDRTWTRLLAARLGPDGRVVVRDLQRSPDTAAISDALDCND